MFFPSLIFPSHFFFWVEPEFSQRRSADYAMCKGTTDQDLQKLTAELLMDHYDIISDPTNLKTAAGRVCLAQKQLLTVVCVIL